MSKKLAYSIDEAAEALGICRVKFYDLLNEGRIRSIKVGARRIIPVSALEEFLADSK